MTFKDIYAKEFEEWKLLFNKAQQYMKSKGESKFLIECAAQHPLKDGLYPGEEFTKRLDTSISLYNLLKSKGKLVKIYVPGSRHMENGKKDKVSLSFAGRTYLISKGVSANDIYSVKANKKYKGLAGVYNSADECFVASKIFKDENFDKLISVVSPAQMYRKTLFYIQFGVIPLNYSAPTDNMYHNYIGEIFGSIPFVLTEDKTWQDDNSNAGIESRNKRCPYLAKQINTISQMQEKNFIKGEYMLDEEEIKKEEESQGDYPMYNDGSSIY